MFEVKKQFVSGFMKGLTIIEKTSVKFDGGKLYTPCAGGSAYVIISCKSI